MASITNKISNIEQSVEGLAARVAALEAGATSVSSSSGWARSWHVLGPMTAPPPLSLASYGTGSSNDKKEHKTQTGYFL